MIASLVYSVMATRPLFELLRKPPSPTATTPVFLMSALQHCEVVQFSYRLRTSWLTSAVRFQTNNEILRLTQQLRWNDAVKIRQRCSTFCAQKPSKRRQFFSPLSCKYTRVICRCDDVTAAYDWYVGEQLCNKTVINAEPSHSLCGLYLWKQCWTCGVEGYWMSTSKWLLSKQNVVLSARGRILIDETVDWLNGEIILNNQNKRNCNWINK